MSAYLLRVTLPSTPAFQVFGLDGTIKTVAVNQGTTMADAVAMLKPKIFRGVPVEARERLEREVGACQLHGRHHALKVLSKIDPNEEALDWIPTGKKGALFNLEFCPTEAEAPAVLPPVGSGSDIRPESQRKFSMRSSNASPPPLRGSSIYLPPGAPLLPVDSCSYFGCHILHVAFKDETGTWVIPEVIDQCISHIKQYGLEQEGIFRISASSVAIERAKQEVDDGFPLTLGVGPDSVTLCSAVLKQLMRELMEPLCTWGFYHPAIYIQRLPISDEKKLEYFQALLHLLPEPNSIIWLKILDLLTCVEENCEANKMTALNLSVVFGPSVCKLKGGDMMVEMGDMPDLNQLFALIIGNGKNMQTPPARPFTACISGSQNDQNWGYLKFSHDDIVLLREESAGTYTGVNMTNGHEGKVLEGAIATRYMDLRVPIEPPPIDFAKKKKKKDPRKERMDKEAEREKERKRKEEEKRLQKQEKQRKEKMRQAHEETQSPSVLKDQLNNQIRLTTEMTHEVHNLRCLVHDVAFELHKAMAAIEKETGKPYVMDQGERVTQQQIEICKLLRTSLQTTPSVPFPASSALPLITNHFASSKPADSTPSTTRSTTPPPTVSPRSSTPPASPTPPARRVVARDKTREGTVTCSERRIPTIPPPVFGEKNASTSSPSLPTRSFFSYTSSASPPSSLSSSPPSPSPLSSSPSSPSPSARSTSPSQTHSPSSSPPSSSPPSSSPLSSSPPSSPSFAQARPPSMDHPPRVGTRVSPRSVRASMPRTTPRNHTTALSNSSQQSSLPHSNPRGSMALTREFLEKEFSQQQLEEDEGKQ